jgi:putative transposase
VRDDAGPADWVEWVNAAQTEAEIEALRKCVNRGTPYGAETWKTRIAATLGLKYTLQPRGRPRKVVGSADTQT